MYDENQKIYNVNFKDKFNIEYPPFLLNDNIRNTSAIHNWCVKETGIGVKIKPSIVEGIEPEVFEVINIRHIVNKIENILNELIIKENVNNKSIVILGDEEIYKYLINNYSTIGKYKIVNKMENIVKYEVYFTIDTQYKGLESDVIIYIHPIKYKDISKYIGYSRGRFYLYIINY